MGKKVIWGCLILVCVTIFAMMSSTVVALDMTLLSLEIIKGILCVGFLSVIEALEKDKR